MAGELIRVSEMEGYKQSLIGGCGGWYMQKPF